MKKSALLALFVVLLSGCDRELSKEERRLEVLCLETNAKFADLQNAPVPDDANCKFRDSK